MATYGQPLWLDLAVEAPPTPPKTPTDSVWIIKRKMEFLPLPKPHKYSAVAVSKFLDDLEDNTNTEEYYTFRVALQAMMKKVDKTVSELDCKMSDEVERLDFILSSSCSRWLQNDVGKWWRAHHTTYFRELRETYAAYCHQAYLVRIYLRANDERWNKVPFSDYQDEFELKELELQRATEPDEASGMYVLFKDLIRKYF